MASYIRTRSLSRVSLPCSQCVTTRSGMLANGLLRCNASYNWVTCRKLLSLAVASQARQLSFTTTTIIPGIKPSFVVPIQRRSYAKLQPRSGKTEADLIVEELQELYENAKDELEIATDSTTSATIYAASDRESARELCDQLDHVYKVYTEMTRSPAAGTPETTSTATEEETVSPNPRQANADRLDAAAAAASAAVDASNPIVASEPLSGSSFIGIAPNYDPEYISVEVKEEVKKRVGQRIRELKSAVERLEQMATHES